jgi:branched-chain amino acid transport system substrate-binding protein
MRLLALLALACLAAVPALAAIPDNTIKVGIINDQSGPLADQSGRGSIIAAQLAADDFMHANPGLKVEILYGDHQNKPDIGSTIVRRWLDQDGVAGVADSVNSAVSLAINQVIHEKNRTFIASNVGTSDLTGKACNDTEFQWSLDTWSLGSAAAHAMTAQGAKSWYFISFDYALGAALERDTTEVVKTLGGRVLGSVRHPLGTTDFSSYLLQAQASGADVLGFGDTGQDLVNAVKQAGEFGITPTQKIVGLFTQITDVKAMGLDVAHDLIVSESFYWDRDDASRAFAKRYAAKAPGMEPTENHAAVYSSVLAFLQAVKAADTIEGDKVVAALKRQPIEDALFGHVVIRQDGRAIHPFYTFRVKKPAESHGPWDLYAPLLTIPADEAFRPMSQGGCPLVH